MIEKNNNQKYIKIQMSMGEIQKQVQIQIGNDSYTFPSFDYLHNSKLLSQMYDWYGPYFDIENNWSESFNLIFEYLMYKQGDTNIAVEKKDTFEKSCIDKRDSEFIKRVVENNSLMQLYYCADYFMMDSLLHLISCYLSFDTNLFVNF